MNKTYKLLALGLLAALGLAVSAFAQPQRVRPGWTTTAAATSLAATTAAVSTIATTAITTTAAATTTDGTPPPPGSVKIVAPQRYSAHAVYYSNVIVGALVQGAVAGGTCTISWGDGTLSEAVLQPDGSGGYSCTATHQYQVRGLFTITVTANDVSALPVSTDSTQIYVI